MEASLKVPDSFYRQEIKIVGVTKSNPDGRNRQDILRKCKAGESVFLKREPENSYDKWAIAVFKKNGEQLGYLPGGDRYTASLIDMGYNMDVKILRIIGGRTFFERLLGQEGKNYGCVLNVVKGEPNWGILRPLVDENSEIDSLEKNTRKLKRKSLKESNYKEIIERIIKLDGKGLHARACRTARIPVKDYSQFLEEEGRLEESLGLIDWYLSYDDYYGSLSAHLKDIEARKKRISKKLKIQEE